MLNEARAEGKPEDKGSGGGKFSVSALVTYLQSSAFGSGYRLLIESCTYLLLTALPSSH